MKHTSNCSSNISCAVYHADGVCPRYKQCNCGADNFQPMPKQQKPKQDCACHEATAYPKITHTKEKCYIAPQPTSECPYGNDDCPKCHHLFPAQGWEGRYNMLENNDWQEWRGESLVDIDIKEFIRKELATQKQKLIEEIEKELGQG